MKAIAISVIIVIFLGFTKMFLWPLLWNNKWWWMIFNKYYYWLLLLATAVVGVMFVVGIIKSRKK